MTSILSDLRVLVVAEDPLARAGLAALLDQQPVCTVVGQVSEAEDVTAASKVYRPDVLVWDLGWESTPDLERLAELAETGPPVVALLAEATPASDVWLAGAQGLLPREVEAERLVAAMAAVTQDLVVVDSALAAAMHPPGDLTPTPPAEELTPRELEVLTLLAEGLSNKAIAYQLGISEHTVKFHVNAIMGKLGAQSRTEAAVRAARLGLIWL